METGAEKLSILFTDNFMEKNRCGLGYNVTRGSTSTLELGLELELGFGFGLGLAYQVNKILNFPFPVSTRLPGLTGSVLVPTYTLELLGL